MAQRQKVRRHVSATQSVQEREQRRRAADLRRFIARERTIARDTVSLRKATEKADRALRAFAEWLSERDGDIMTGGAVEAAARELREREV
jgi:predicted HTH domain antitoxin